MDISHRKVKRTVRFIYEDNKPVAGSRIHVKQTNHKFLFGCGAFDIIPYAMSFDKKMAEEAEKDPRLLEFLKGYDGETIANSWLEIFNYGTLPFYWGQYEPNEGEIHKEGPVNATKFLREKNVKVKGHPLCWHTACADWLKKYDNETVMKKQLDRIEREVSGFKGVIDIWDAINEVVIMPVFEKDDNAITRVCKDKGRVNMVKEVFAKAHESNPDAFFLINDFNTSDAYARLIDECLEAGVKIDAIGIQSHQHQGFWGAEKLGEVLDRFSRFGLPIHFTENTLISGEIMPAYIEDLNDWKVPEWPSTPEGEERQAREMEEMYRILFSHPLVEAITTWDFKDGAWLGAPSGFLHKDNTRKPSFEMLKRLTHEEWWTDIEVVTDDNGYATVECFKGEYELSDGTGAKTEVTMDDDSNMEVVLLR